VLSNEVVKFLIVLAEQKSNGFARAPTSCAPKGGEYFVPPILSSFSRQIQHFHAVTSLLSQQVWVPRFRPGMTLSTSRQSTTHWAYLLQMNTCTHSYMHVCMNVCLHTYINSYLHTHLHAYVRLHLHDSLQHSTAHIALHPHAHSVPKMCIHAGMHTH